MAGAITNASNDTQSIRNSMVSLRDDMVTKSAAIDADGFPHLSEILDGMVATLNQSIHDLNLEIDALSDAAAVSGL